MNMGSDHNTYVYIPALAHVTQRASWKCTQKDCSQNTRNSATKWSFLEMTKETSGNINGHVNVEGGCFRVVLLLDKEVQTNNGYWKKNQLLPGMNLHIVCPMMSCYTTTNPSRLYLYIVVCTHTYIYMDICVTIIKKQRISN